MAFTPNEIKLQAEMLWRAAVLRGVETNTNFSAVEAKYSDLAKEMLNNVPIMSYTNGVHGWALRDGRPSFDLSSVTLERTDEATYDQVPTLEKWGIDASGNPYLKPDH